MTDKRQYLITAAKSAASLLILVSIVFLCAGRLSYWQGWVLTAVTAARIVFGLILFRDRPDLVQERMKPGPGMKGWDKVFVALGAPLSFAVTIVAALDGGRFGWTPPLPVWVYACSVIVLLFSHGIVLWAMWTNRWFSSVVRIQDDRDQRTVTEGPYRFVRHPGYVGIILSFVSASIVLGSLWALIPTALVVILLVIRTALEDKTLRRELVGYADYANRVGYRLLPGIW